MNALDPVQRVDRQILEAIKLHEPKAGKVGGRIKELLTTVGLSSTHGRTQGSTTYPACGCWDRSASR